jgi:outer membrane protein
MRSILLAASILAGFGMAAAPALAQSPGGKKAGDIMVRARLIGVMPLDSSSSTSIGGRVETAAAVTPELDFSYFITDNVALELIAATSRHTIKAKGTALGDVSVGSTWVLPPTLTVQYHFMPKAAFSPYVGAGLNYTMFYGAKPAAGLGSLKLSNNVGYALQAGVDYALTERVYLNVDVKQIFLHTDAKVNGGAVRARTNLNPLVVGVGVGYKF